MSQFPAVNTIDPVGPTSMQGIGVGSDNLNQAAARALEAARIRAQAAIAEKQADLQATQLEQEGQLAEQQMQTQRDIAKQQSDTTLEAQREQSRSFAEHNASQERMNQERMAAEQAMEQQRIQSLQARDRRSEELTLKLQLNALKAGKETSAAKIETIRELSRNEVEKQNLMRSAAKNEQEIAAENLKIAQTIDTMARATQKAEEVGLAANKKGLQSLSFAQAGMKTFEERSLEGRSPIVAAVGSAVQQAAAFVGAVGKEDIANLDSPDQVATELSGAWADGAADAISAMSGVKNPDSVRGLLKDILNSATVFAATNEAQAQVGAVDDNSVLGAARENLWGAIEPKLAELEKAGVPKATVFAAVEDLVNGVDELQHQLGVEGLKAEPEGEMPGDTTLRSAQVKAFGRLKSAGQLLNAAGVGRVQRAYDSSELKSAVLASVAQYGDMEHISAFLADNPDMSQSFVESVTSQLGASQMQKLLAGKKSLAERAEQLGKEALDIHLKGATKDTDLFGQQITDLESLIAERQAP